MKPSKFEFAGKIVSTQWILWKFLFLLQSTGNELFSFNPNRILAKNRDCFFLSAMASNAKIKLIGIAENEAVRRKIILSVIA